MIQIMRLFLLFVLLLILNKTGISQEELSTPKKWGITLASYANTEVYPVQILPGVSYSLGKSEFYFGLGFHPVINEEQRIISGNFKYRYYHHNRSKLFSGFIVGSMNYVQNRRKNYFTLRGNYMLLQAGYGFSFRIKPHFYLSSYIAFGPYGYWRKTNNPYPFEERNGSLFDRRGFLFSGQVGYDYRF